jgi:outer membrane protein TolC
MRKSLIVSLLVLNVFNFSFAEELQLSLKEAMRLASKDNYNLKLARNEVSSAIYQKQLVETNKYPKIGVEVSGFLVNEMKTKNDPIVVTLAPGNVVTLPPFDTVTPDHLYKAELNITQPLYLGGSIKNNIEAASQLQKNKSDILIQAKQDVLFQTVASYFNVVRAKKSYSVEEKIINLSKKNLEDVTVKFEAKAVTKYELIRAESDVLEAEVSFNQAFSDLQNSKFELANILHISPDFVTTDSFAFVETSPEVEKEIANALKNRYDIKSFSKLINALEAQSKAISSEYKPQVFFRASGGGQMPEMGLFGGEDKFGPTYQVGLVVQWNIFDGFKKNKRIQSIENDKNKWKTQQQILTERIKEEVRKACLNIEQSKKLVEISLKAQEKAKEVYDLVTIGYQNQKNTQLELLDARLQMSKSYRDLVNATFRHELARVQLDYIAGKFSEETNPLVK